MQKPEFPLRGQVEGVISHTIKTGCIVDIEGLNAFLPNNHLVIVKLAKNFISERISKKNDTSKR